MTSRPLAASRRNPLAVMDPSGYSSAAANSSRSGVSSAIWSRGGNVGVRVIGVRKAAYRSLEIVQAVAGWAKRGAAVSRHVAERRPRPLLGPAARVVIAGGAVLARSDQLPVRRIAGDAAATADRLVVGRGRLGTQFVVSVVSVVSGPCFQWVSADVMTQIIRRQHVVSAVVSIHPIAATTVFGACRCC